MQIPCHQICLLKKNQYGGPSKICCLRHGGPVFFWHSAGGHFFNHRKMIISAISPDINSGTSLSSRVITYSTLITLLRVLTQSIYWWWKSVFLIRLTPTPVHYCITKLASLVIVYIPPPGQKRRGARRFSTRFRGARKISTSFRGGENFSFDNLI